VFVAVGCPEPVARRVGDALVDANLVGHDSHGVIRIPQYVAAVRDGEVVPSAEPTVIRDTDAAALVDGQWGFGQVTAERATRLAIEKAKALGLGMAGAVRCNHIGRVGEYSEMAAQSGVVAFVTTGGFGGRGGRAAPFGGREGVLGTNPLSFGFPGRDGTAMLVDFATTAVAAGKIAVARAKGEPLPAGSILDKDGNPTNNAEDFYAGGVQLPFGGHKGYALQLVVELLGRVLTGADDYAEGNRGGPVYGHAGAVVLAIDAGVFRDADKVVEATEATLDRIRAVPPAPGFDRVMIPGVGDAGEARAGRALRRGRDRRGDQEDRRRAGRREHRALTTG